MQLPLPQTMHFSGQLCLHVIALIPTLQHKGVKRSKLFSWARFWRCRRPESLRHQLLGARGTVALGHQESRHCVGTDPEPEHTGMLALFCPGPGAQVTTMKRSVYVRGGSVTFAVSFFFLFNHHHHYYYLHYYYEHSHIFQLKKKKNWSTVCRAMPTRFLRMHFLLPSPQTAASSFACAFLRLQLEPEGFCCNRFWLQLMGFI